MAESLWGRFPMSGCWGVSKGGFRETERVSQRERERQRERNRETAQEAI